MEGTKPEAGEMNTVFTAMMMFEMQGPKGIREVSLQRVVLQVLQALQEAPEQMAQQRRALMVDLVVVEESLS